MTAMYTAKSDNLTPLLAGTAAPATAAPLDTDGFTLAPGTYYIPIGGSEAPLPAECFLASVHAKWSATLAATITVESSNFPARKGGLGGKLADNSDVDASTGNWIQENPAGATVYSAGGAGNNVAAQTVTAGGTNAGGVIIYLPNAAARRYRLKVVVTTGGTLRAGASGKD